MVALLLIVGIACAFFRPVAFELIARSSILHNCAHTHAFDCTLDMHMLCMHQAWNLVHGRELDPVPYQGCFRHREQLC